jgi:acetyltransferase-like isoleucine patch superfamily enzyme
MTLIKALVVVMPWPLKRLLLRRLFGYELSKSARIGLSWIYPRKLIMADDAWIGHLSVAVHLDLVDMRARTRLGRGNWITGLTADNPKHFLHQEGRVASLVMGEESAITKGHHIDCTSPVTIGKFTTVAGYGTQVLTHSVNFKLGRQDSAPVTIGDYCFVGTRCVLLGGAVLPHRSVLAAASVLGKSYDEPLGLYAGNPASRVRDFESTDAYFTRERGFVD